MRIEIPELAVVVLIGVSSSGKSTFAGKHFKKTEILSSDYFRGLISDDENNQKVNKETFETLYYIADKRLDLGRLTVIDATNVQKDARASALKLAKAQNCHAVAIVLNVSEKICQERNAQRSDRQFKEHVINNQASSLRRSIKSLKKEGFRYIYVLDDEGVENAEIVRVPLWNNRTQETGPFDIIGDIHGCYDELCELLQKLDYQVDKEHCSALPPEGRKALFLGDLCDRGNGNMAVLKLVMNMVESGAALCVAGNHDVKLLKYLRGKHVQMTHGLDKTVAELEHEPEEFKEKAAEFIDSLISHYVLDGGRLVAVHAGLKEKYHGRASGRVREFCLYGETTGETDEYGLPVRLEWVNEYRGKAMVVYGHTSAADVQIMNNTYCIDTGCVYGGMLTALKYPEKELVQVAAKAEYYTSIRPLKPEAEAYDDILNIEDVTGQRYISTKLRSNIKIQEENSIAALEIMSRFAADPHWLIYLPPTMSPCETSKKEEYLEYPLEAFHYYQSKGIGKVVCEQKHMGSRAVVVLCKDNAAAKNKFKIQDSRSGIIYTRTGRNFFDDAQMETEILDRLRKVLDKTNFWEVFGTDWVCLDTELMPWSAKALKLLEDQYAGVGRSGRNGLDRAVEAIQKGAAIQKATEQAEGSVDLEELLSGYNERKKTLDLYTDAYRQYCWNVNTIDDYKIAPFHILATEAKVWNDENHVFHMEIIKKYMTGVDNIFMATPYQVVDLQDEASVSEGVSWWENLTGTGGEGMVVKPLDFIAHKGTALLQPAVKCRGKEYLRIIYGPEYTLKNNMQRLKKRSLTKKRNLALNEFSLGMESLERFVNQEPLYKVHECVFGVLALESEPVDPRL